MDRWTDGPQPHWLGFEESCSLLPLQGKQVFSLVHLKFPAMGGTSSGQVPLHHSNSEDESYCWPLPGQTRVLRNTGCFI